MNYPPVLYDRFRLAGGLDQTTPTLDLKAGVLRRAVNFEAALTGGYSRIGGYERYDGHARPSDATWTIITYSPAVGNTINVGDTITGQTSGATAKIIALSGNDIVVTRVTGSFQIGENITDLAPTSDGSITSLSAAAADGAVANTYQNLAADEYRSSIAAPTGAGAILGGGYFNGKNYCFRNNAGNTAAVMYVSSASGWTAVTFGREISFTNANVNVTEGDTLTQGSVTATIRRVIVQTGTLVSGTNTGRLIIDTLAGGEFAAGAATSTGAGALTLSGASTAITLLPSGKFRCVVGNFGAGSTNASMYFCDGVNRAHEFDGTNLVPISTGMTDDTPDLIAVHKNHLFLAFGYSLQFSSLGSPYVWTPVTGAGEIGMADTITNLLVLPGDQTSGAMAVFTKTDTSILYGTSSTTFALTTFNSGSGAIADTAQNLEQTYLLNNFGVQTLATTRDFGNFNPTALTANITPYINERLLLATCATLNRTKSQYRLFFSDGSGLYLTIAAGKYMGSMPVEFPNPVVCAWEGQTSTGRPTTYFGSSNGMVYEMDAGTSFDGSSISSTLELVFNNMGNNRVLKRYRKASIEMSSTAYVQFNVGYALAYNSQEVEQGVDQSYSQYLRAAYWDSFTWDAFIWDGSGTVPAEIDLTGTAENIAIKVTADSDETPAYTLSSITTHYTQRRGLR